MQEQSPKDAYVLPDSQPCSLAGAAVAGAATVYLSGKSTKEVATAVVDTAKEELQQLVNWSGTHNVRPKRFFQPETIEEVEQIVRKAHEQGIWPEYLMML